MTDVLTVDRVRKTYASVRAVDGVSFTVPRGEIFALLGPNGAGKTTLVRMILGILVPDDGEVRFAFGSHRGRPDTSRIGYLPEERGLYADLPMAETLTYLGTLRGMAEHDARTETLRWLERLELGDRAKEKLQTLSKGNQQKVQFIASVLHKPDLAVLDEPFSGLDPVNQSRFLAILEELRASGMTILLSAHQMNLVERIADRILLIRQGRTLLHGTLDEIRRQVSAGQRLLVRPRQPVDVDSLRTHLPGNVTAESGEDGLLRLRLGDTDDLGATLARIGRDVDPIDIRLERLDLHDIYVAAVEQSPDLATAPEGDR